MDNKTEHSMTFGVVAALPAVTPASHGVPASHVDTGILNLEPAGVFLSPKSWQSEYDAICR